MASPPACRMSASTADSASASLPWSATFAPSRTNSAAIAAPMPRELPVTNATLSFKRHGDAVVTRLSKDWLVFDGSQVPSDGQTICITDVNYVRLSPDDRL